MQGGARRRASHRSDGRLPNRHGLVFDNALSSTDHAMYGTKNYSIFLIFLIRNRNASMRSHEHNQI